MKPDKKRQQFEAYINKLVGIFTPIFNVNEYTLVVEYPNKLKDAAEIVIDYKYLSAKIRVGPETYKYYLEGKIDWVNKDICHEFSHLLTEPIYEFALPYVPKDHRKMYLEILERQTQRIANTVISNIKL